MSTPCPNCGSPVQAGHRFCSNCGYLLKPSEIEQAAPSDKSTPANAPTGSIEPITYVVQRYDSPAVPTTPTPTPDADAAPQSNPTRLPDDPFPTFVPPPPRSIAPPSVPPAPASSDRQQGAYNVPMTGGSNTFGNFAPPAAGRAVDGPPGAYAPFSPTTAKQLESPSGQRSWLLPVVIASVAVLLLLAVGAGYFLLNGKTGTGSTANTGSTGSIERKLPATASDEDKVKETVQISNEEQIRALHDLDPSVLKGTRLGAILDEHTRMVQTLLNQHMYADARLVHLDFGTILVQGNTATVRTTETWTMTLYGQQTHQAIPGQSSGPSVLHETYHLVKQNGQWMITSIDIDEQPTAPPTVTPSIT